MCTSLVGCTQCRAIRGKSCVQAAHRLLLVCSSPSRHLSTWSAVWRADVADAACWGKSQDRGWRGARLGSHAVTQRGSTGLHNIAQRQHCISASFTSDSATCTLSRHTSPLFSSLIPLLHLPSYSAVTLCNTCLALVLLQR